MKTGGREVKSQPGVVFFDAAGTLIRLAAPVGEVYAKKAQELGAATDSARMEQAFRQAWRAQPLRPAVAGPRDEDDRPWWRTLADSALQSAATLPPGFPEEKWFDSVYRHFARPEAWELYEDVVPALENLSRDHRLAVLSNFDRRLRGILDGLGILPFFEQVLLSSEIGADKPDPQIFTAALRAMNAPASACWHVGDDPLRDWEGAHLAGLSVFALQRPSRSLAELPSLIRSTRRADPPC